jgi:hypothetical protein
MKLRALTQVVVLHGKLYVLGGRGRADSAAITSVHRVHPPGSLEASHAKHVQAEEERRKHDNVEHTKRIKEKKHHAR